MAVHTEVSIDVHIVEFFSELFHTEQRWMTSSGQQSYLLPQRILLGRSKIMSPFPQMIHPHNLRGGKIVDPPLRPHPASPPYPSAVNLALAQFSSCTIFLKSHKAARSCCLRIRRGHFHLNSACKPFLVNSRRAKKKKKTWALTTWTGNSL